MDNNSNVVSVIVGVMFYVIGSLSVFMLTDKVFPEYFPWAGIFLAVVYCLVITLVFNALAVWQAQKAIEVMERQV